MNSQVKPLLEVVTSSAVLSLTDIVVADFEGARKDWFTKPEIHIDSLHEFLERYNLRDNSGDLYDGYFINKFVAGAALTAVVVGYHLSERYKDKFPKLHKAFDYAYNNPLMTLGISAVITSGIIIAAETVPGVGTADIKDLPAGVAGAFASSGVLYFGLFRKSIRELKNHAMGTLYYFMIPALSCSISEIISNTRFFPHVLKTDIFRFINEVSPRFTTYPITGSEAISTSSSLIDKVLSYVKKGYASRKATVES
jgi:hypothetical protein